MLAYEKRLDQLLPVEESINERFERMALSYPEQLALIYDEKSISYQDFHEFCERGARLLRTAYRLLRLVSRLEYIRLINLRRFCGYLPFCGLVAHT